jgi:hypothetical protein
VTLALAKNRSIDLDGPEVKADGLRIWIAGESGSGKSNVAALIIAQAMAAGRQVVVLDAHGEMGALWQVAPRSVACVGYLEGYPPGETPVEDCIQLVESGASVFVSMKDWTDTEPEKLDVFVLEFMRRLYALRKKNPKPTLLVVEEAHQFIPQMQMKGQSKNVRLFIGIITGGRKYGLDAVLCSQRGALVDVSAVAGCNVRIFMRASDHKDWKVVRQYVPKKLGLTHEEFSKFKPGEAILLSRWWEPKRVEIFRPKVAPAKMR